MFMILNISTVAFETELVFVVTARMLVHFFTFPIEVRALPLDFAGKM